MKYEYKIAIFLAIKIKKGRLLDTDFRKLPGILTNSVAFHNKSRGVARWLRETRIRCAKKDERLYVYGIVRRSFLPRAPQCVCIFLLVTPSQPSHTRSSHVSEKHGPPPFTHTLVRRRFIHKPRLPTHVTAMYPPLFDLRPTTL